MDLLFSQKKKKVAMIPRFIFQIMDSKLRPTEINGFCPAQINWEWAFYHLIKAVPVFNLELELGSNIEPHIQPNQPICLIGL